MEYIERPKEISRAESNVQNREFLQKNMQSQINNIYDYLDMMNDSLGGKILYKNNAFATTGTLNDTIMNYARIKIYAKSSDNHNVIQEVLTSQANSNGVAYTSFFSGSIAENYFYGKSARLILNKNVFTLDRMSEIDFRPTPKITFTELNTYTILKIVGFKY